MATGSIIKSNNTIITDERSILNIDLSTKKELTEKEETTRIIQFTPIIKGTSSS
jgi:hypothetical protein